MICGISGVSKTITVHRNFAPILLCWSEIIISNYNSFVINDSSEVSERSKTSGGKQHASKELKSPLENFAKNAIATQPMNRHQFCDNSDQILK